MKHNDPSQPQYSAIHASIIKAFTAQAYRQGCEAPFRARLEAEAFSGTNPWVPISLLPALKRDLREMPNPEDAGRLLAATISQNLQPDKLREAS